MVTFDTNVAIYALSDDALKAAVAQRVIADSHFVSVQVLNEAANVLHRKRGLPWGMVAPLLDRLRSAIEAVLPVTNEVHREGVRLAQRYQLAFYDSLLLAAALSGGATTFFSEDMQDGLVLDDSLRIINPFLRSPV